MTTQPHVILLVDETVTYQIAVPVADLIPAATEAGHAPTTEGVQDWIAEGGIGPDDQIVTDELGGDNFLAVQDRRVDPEARVENLPVEEGGDA